MPSCEFDPASCEPTCKKYPVCAFYAIQKQFSQIQEEINFIYKLNNKLGEELSTMKTVQKFQNKNLESVVNALYSYTSQNPNKECLENEQDN